MNCVVEGILDINEIIEYKIVDTIDIYNYINVYENNNVNINKNKIVLQNTNNIDENIEILGVEIYIKDKTINKISNEITSIYTMNFIFNINIKVHINSKIKDIKIKDIYSKSLIYKNVNVSDLDVHPINFELKNVDNKIAFLLNCIIVDKSKDLVLEDLVELSDKRNENINNKDYSYIDINQEFN